MAWRQEAVVICLFMALFHYLVGVVVCRLGAATGASAAGFLCWNFPPARIFMGMVAVVSWPDAGSPDVAGCRFISSVLVGMASHARSIVVDATWTLLNRYRLKCRLSEAHRTHGYQYLARRWQSHRNVTLAVLFINSLWLAPIAVMIVLGQLDGVIGMVIAYLPLAFLAYHLKAGVPE